MRLVLVLAALGLVVAVTVGVLSAGSPEQDPPAAIPLQDEGGPELSERETKRRASDRREARRAVIRQRRRAASRQRRSSQAGTVQAPAERTPPSVASPAPGPTPEPAGDDDGADDDDDGDDETDDGDDGDGDGDD